MSADSNPTVPPDSHDDPLDDLGTDLGRLRRLAHCLVSDAALADDAVQDAMLMAMTRRPSRLANVRAWVDTVLRHRVRRLGRRQAQRAKVEGAAARPEAVPGSDEIAATAELHQRLAAEVSALSEPYRAAIVLRFLHGLSADEVARRTRVPLETARTRVKRGLVLLRQRLDGQYGQRAAWAGLVSLGIRPTSAIAATTIVMSLKPIAIAAAAIAAAGLFFVLSRGANTPAASGTPSPEVAEVAVASAAAPPPTLLNAVRAAVEPPAIAAAACDPEVLSGRVVAADGGAPIAGATVALSHSDADEFGCLDVEYSARVEELGTALTDADGGFRFAVRRARLHRLAVQSAGFAPRQLLKCTGGAQVSVTLSRGVTLRGVVRAKSTPLEGIPLEIAERRGSLLATTTTAKAGAFECNDLPAVPVFVQIRSPRHTEQWREVDLVVGQLTHVEIDLEPGRAATGRITDAVTGLPIAGAEVSDDWTFASARTARSAVDGRFVLAGIARTGAELHVRAPGYAADLQQVPSDVSEPMVEIALRRGASVRGRLLGADGQPPSGAYVAAAASWLTNNRMHTHWCRGDIQPSGHFEVNGLRGACQLMLRAPGAGMRVYDLPRGSTDGAVLHLGDITLLPGAGVEGRVRDERGAWVANAQVTIQGANTDCATAFAHLAAPVTLDVGPSSLQIRNFAPVERQTATDGAFRFAGLAGGTYEITVVASGCLPVKTGPLVIVDGEVLADVEATVKRAQAIAGRVELPPDLPADAVRKLRLTACDTKSHAHETVRAAADGSFRIDGLGGDRYIVSAFECPPGYALSPVYDVAAGTEDLALRLVPALTISGRVVDAKGTPVRTRVRAQLTRETAFMSKNHATDDEGRFELFVAPDFVGSVHTSHPDKQFVQATIEGVIAGARDLVLQLER